MILWIRSHFTKRRESGQAQVEMLFMILFLFAFMIGAYETSILFHNVIVLQSAVRSATWAASLGAPDKEIENIIYTRSANLIPSIFMKTYPEFLAIEIWSDVDNTTINIAPTAYYSSFTPKAKYRAEYIFRATNYNIRVGIPYTIGIHIPIIQQNLTVKLTVLESFRIQVQNDEDHDGMVDLYEVEYFQGRRGEGVNPYGDPLPSAALWSPRSHNDSSVLVGSATVDSDQDGKTDYKEELGTFQNAHFDYDNDDVEDKLDFIEIGKIRNPLHTGIW